MVYTFSLKNKVVIITGGYGHLGKAITESFLYHEATVYVMGRDEAKFNEAFPDSTINKSLLHFVSGDISGTDSIINSFQTVFDKEGKIDVLIVFDLMHFRRIDAGEKPQRSVKFGFLC